MKFSGKVGFLLPAKEVDQDVWEPVIEERYYTGDITRNYRKNQESQYLNSNLVLNTQIGILSDQYMQQNWPSIAYILWNGVRWEVKTIDVGYPRLVLEIGGVYHGTGSEGTREDTSNDHGWEG